MASSVKQSAPASVITAMPHQIVASKAGEPRDRAIPAGVRKMPSEMASPVTTAVAAHTPICRLVWGRASIVRPSYEPDRLLRISLWVDA